MNSGVWLMAGAVLLLGIIAAVFERKRLTAKELAVIAAMAGIAALGRVPFAVIPSAQPTTFMVIISGFVFGCTAGFWVGAAAAVVSNIFLGQGPWTFIQMLAWGACGLSAGLLGRVMPRAGKIVLTGFGILWGFFFGWLTNIWHWVTFVYPLTWGTWLATNILSFGFDAVHAAANGLFLFFFGKDFIRILTRFKSKFAYTHFPQQKFNGMGLRKENIDGKRKIFKLDSGGRYSRKFAARIHGLGTAGVESCGRVCF